MELSKEEALQLTALTNHHRNTIKTKKHLPGALRVSHGCYIRTEGTARLLSLRSYSAALT